MYAITFPGSILGMAVFLFKETDGGPNANRPWHRAEHIVRVFEHKCDAESALAEYRAWVGKETAFTPPECNGYLERRLKQASIILAKDVPKKTEAGYPFILQYSDDQDLSVPSGWLH